MRNGILLRKQYTKKIMTSTEKNTLNALHIPCLKMGAKWNKELS